MKGINRRLTRVERRQERETEAKPLIYVDLDASGYHRDGQRLTADQLAQLRAHYRLIVLDRSGIPS